MKKLVLLAILWMFHLGIYAQSPTKMSYQAVLRNPSGELVGNKQIRVKVSILEKSETGNVVFAELQQIATNVNGLFSLIVGDGKAESGDIAKIDWSKGLYYIKTEIDPDGGTNYSLVNTSQLLSVPYALYATNTKPGPKGDKGETGDKGADGKDGAQGPKGDKGDIGDKGLDGKDGAQGPKGDKGDPGDKGADGKDGAQGPKGDKGDPGDKGADGKDGAQGPKGDKGDIGDKGADGKDGAQGPKGDKGDIGDKGLDGKDGAQGPKGDKGDIGDKGADGKDGAQGPKGDKGDIGDKGADGKDGAQGLKGDKGDTGDKGADGKDGAQGPKGDKGDFGDKGADGKDGIQGPKGDKGDTGDKGADGKDGAQGPKGDKGDTGEKGLDGQTGAQGPKGDKGEPGDKGADGKDGLQGPKGDKGDAGAGFQAGSIKNQLLYWNGTAWVILNPGSNGERLTICDDELTWAVGGICPGKIEALNCGTATNIGTLIADTPANGVSSILAYTGGNSGGYSTQTIASTGVTGLTATLTAGILANGNGSLTFEISGTPSASGTASFEVNIGGKSCVIILNVNEKITNELLKNQVQDIDGNNYKTVIIGNKLWMTENLRVSKYKDGEIIENTNILAPTVWPNLQSGAYCHYNYDNSNDLLFGKLYNWYAVNTEKLCPNGWRMPRNNDWEELIDNVGGIDVAGGLLKISGKEYWQTNTTISENKFLFSATGSGWNVGDFRDQLIKGFYWSSQAADMGNGYGFSVFDNQNKIEKEIVGKTIGGAVRCIRDTIAPILIQGSIEGIDCNKVINKGVLIANVPASKVSAELPYTGGNNGSYSGQSITSTGVIGLTATLSTGTFENGNGTLIYEISGTPSTNGTAIFAVNIGGANCNLQINVISKLEKGIEGNSLKDIDGNSYKTVIIGSQLWMSENLKVSKYNTGEKIENTNLLPQNVWPNLQSGAFCNYNYDSGNDLLYGKLYNWYAVNTQKLCPKGWRMPRNNDWEALSDYVGGKELAGEILKISGKDYWQTNTVISQNKFKFSATGSGWNVGDFRDQLTKGFYWSAQGADIYNAYGFSIIDNQNKAEVEMAGKMIGGAVRCMKDTIPPIPIQGSIQTIDCGTATNNGTLTANTPANGVSSVIAYTGGNGGTHSGQTISSTGVTGLTATLAAGTFANGNGSLTYEISGTPSASGTASFEINIGGKTCTLTRNVAVPTSGYGENITDVDGNSYKTVYIGTQQWMGENLKVSKYNDGTTIPNVTGYGEWLTDKLGRWSYYGNDEKNNAIYGKLYNGYSVNSNKLCPTNWHVPNVQEWTILTEYLGGANVAGGKMKSVGTEYWNSPNTDATNVSGFSAYPAGIRYWENGVFYHLGTNTGWWSSSSDEASNLLHYGIANDKASIENNYTDKKMIGISVRCIKDNNTYTKPIQGTINTLNCENALNNGTLTKNTLANKVSIYVPYIGGNGGVYNEQITPSTNVIGLNAILEAGKLKNGNDTLVYDISGTPTSSGIANFLIKIGGQECTLKFDVSMITTNEKSFNPNLNYGSLTDQEGNIYKTIVVGNQTWMAENLKTSKYNDNSIIPNVSGYGEWLTDTLGKWCYYNNDVKFNEIYGKLYNAYTIHTGKLCPSGWRIPSETDWSILIDYLGGANLAGDKMKSIGTNFWLNPNTGATNESGFSALPGGIRYWENARFYYDGVYANWWSSSIDKARNALHYGLTNNKSTIENAYTDKKTIGISVRCIKDNTPPLPIQGSIQGIDCGTATNNGTLTANTSANGVSSVIAYTGGNGGTHLGQTISSTGVTGLTATLAAGTFKNGDSTVTYEISGTPSASGTASFEVNIGGKTCTLTKTVNAATIEIGNFYQGGKIAYILKYGDPGYDPNKIKGLIVTTSDQGTASWGCYGTELQGADNNEIGAGLQNTLDIINGCKTANIAAKICNDLVVDQYDDWFLPSANELSILYTNRTTIGGFQNVFYWSSTEGTQTMAGYAKCLNFADGRIYGNRDKGTGYYVRAVRYFNVLNSTPIQGSIQSIDCGTATNNGTLTENTPASGVSSVIAYTGGNGGSHQGQTISSTGVTGLTATLVAGKFAKGDSTVSYEISGTPSASGTASFTVNIGGKTCTLLRSIILPVGTINSIDCASATKNGTLNRSLVANNVNILISYTGGNGGSHNGQIVTSTGVTGLTATLEAGIFANGNGSLNYIISGTPKTAGTANFAVNIGDKTCTLSSTVNGATFDILNPNMTYDNLTDQDGNAYKTIVIGSQTWMAENLRTSKYANGDPIPNVTNDTEWENLNSGAWANLSNNSQYENPYGKLYNWYTVVDVRNICPTGWHVPTMDDWITLENYLGGNNVAGKKLKSTNYRWRESYNEPNSNESGFSGLPSSRRHDNGSFASDGTSGIWWSTLSNNLGNWAISLDYEASNTYKTNQGKNMGFSVRCLKGEPSTQPIKGAVQSIDCDKATNNGTLIANTASSGVSSVIVYTNGNGSSYDGQSITSTGVTGLTATLSAGTFATYNGIVTYEISGTPSASGIASFEINIGGKTCTLTRNVIVPTSGYGENITDVDGNSYKTVYIGTQQWMGENLKVSKYNDGTDIPNITNGTIFANNTDNTQWINQTSGAWCYNNNTEANNAKYGKLYNWYAVSPLTNGNKNVCPTGWHVPTNTEWTILTDYLGGKGVAEGKLKEVGTANWDSPNSEATNSSLFTALPGGFRIAPGFFGAIGASGIWWGSNETSSIKAWYYQLDAVSPSSTNYINDKRDGLSIRCLKGEPITPPQPIQGSIQTIDCGTATNNGTLTANTPLSGVSSVIAYTGGNGGTHSGQTISSTGVTGLTATLAAGTFANGNGSLTYEISGTPSTSGTASFEINIGGKTCSLNRPVNKALPVESISALNCGSLSKTGNLFSGLSAESVSFAVGYSQGNNSAYPSASFNSTGVTGLTATLAAGYFWDGQGSPAQEFNYSTGQYVNKFNLPALNFEVSGTPSSVGTASFTIQIDGKTCSISMDVKQLATSGENITDLAGNTYKTVQIGNQQWMAENLKNNKVNGFNVQTGTSGEFTIPYLTNVSNASMVSGAYCLYHPDDSQNMRGLLYNSEVISTFQNAQICPSGWRIPTQVDYDLLVNYLGGEQVAAAKLKSSVYAITNWSGWPSITNTNGFNAVNAGYISVSNTAGNVGGNATDAYSGWWYSNSVGSNNAVQALVLENSSDKAYIYKSDVHSVSSSDYNNLQSHIGGKSYMSIRCIKDIQYEGYDPYKGLVYDLKCNDATKSGSLIVGQTANEVTLTLPYSNSTGQSYKDLTVYSTGVSGLMATIDSGIFNSGMPGSNDGNFTFKISGIPSKTGDAIFHIYIGGKTCDVKIPILN